MSRVFSARHCQDQLGILSLHSKHSLEQPHTCHSLAQVAQCPSRLGALHRALKAEGISFGAGGDTGAAHS